ncbi:MAG: c-type cytochrome [Planctomycetales bacterium]|nr:c-type cytochrome [Planctomycetales bacterium]
MPNLVLLLIPIGSLLLAAGPPEKAVEQMQVADGFRVELVAAEPLVRQPVAIDFDDRGRLWAIQYLQYPNPAGLKRVAVDRYSRTKYDRVPEPPPRGPRGADRITILEDTDGDGRVDRAKDFVSGLNFATGFAFGHGGLFVLNVPYLLFYPDRNHDDVPDADPDVLLTGFGMDDAHSVANSLTWGPDGWLYGCQGSTVTANIRGIEFQQGVWRYHPLTHEFELFCEGGGNSWGLDFDRHGQLVYSTNFGGHVMLHGVQGAYYWKSFGKHGALHNPYAYGYFDHVPHTNFRGGHVTVGGLIYRGDLFPASFRDKYIAGDLLAHGVHWNHVEPAGSTVRSAHGGDFIVSRDTWFAPCDVTQGPDGAIYVADWHDARTAHPDPDAEWDRSNGRVFRIRPVAEVVRLQKRRSDGLNSDEFSYDFPRRSSTELVALLSHRNSWIVTRARRILAERRDPEVIFPLRTLVQESPDEQLQLEALWALYVSGGFDEAFGVKLLDHRNAHIRRWAVRLLGDEFGTSAPSPPQGERAGVRGERVTSVIPNRSVDSPAPHPRPLSPWGGEGRSSIGTATRLLELAANEPDIHVRSQLACTAKRLPGRVGLPIVHRLLSRDEDATDGYVPLLCWWAVERHAVNDLDLCLDLFATPDAWKSSFVRNAILDRLTRRLAAEGTSATLRGCARMLAAAPSDTERLRLVAAIEQGLRDGSRREADSNLGTLFTNQAEVRSLDSNTNPQRQRGSGVAESPSLTLRVRVPELDQQLRNLWSDAATDLPLIRLLARFGDESAWRRVRNVLADRSAGAPLRTAIIQFVGEAGGPKATDDLLALLAETEPDAIRIAALDALRSEVRDDVATRLLTMYPASSDRVRQKLRDVLLSRHGWAGRLVAEVESKRIAAKDVSVEQLRLVALHNDVELDERVRKLWGSIKPGTPEEKLAEMRRLSNDLRAGSGDAVRGRELFRKQCATCHQLFGEGEKIGPDLTHANRADRDYLLASMVDPGAVVRAEYLSYVISTTDGRVFTGLIAQQSPTEVTLLGAKNERTTIRRDQIDELRESPTSLMPEDQLKQLKPQELRDLFQYLQSRGSEK